MNAFEQKTKHSSAREKLKEKMLKKRAMQIENAMANQSQSRSQSQTTSHSSNVNECIAQTAPGGSVKYTLTDTNKPNNYKFSIDGGVGENEFTPVQGVSMALNKLIQEEEAAKPKMVKSSKKKGKKH